ncbi:uncharacterized protein EV420DRAFT_1647153 [Desarmillaria tabescens]|uniref:Uncharacterized protein n=1 Tax=Armillaria tabescens TaxID=1929756 RepID=A0AA39JUE2_ARMTA|nr:uncharacterized protein EV420DRAFT_1647153 [Desarmillaria tabescens]KAK0449106.1 hypothetical protein EV420DRAFT_1647153 [Desarmillaria tabescens]
MKALCEEICNAFGISLDSEVQDSDGDVIVADTLDVSDVKMNIAATSLDDMEGNNVEEWETDDESEDVGLRGSDDESEVLKVDNEDSEEELDNVEEELDELYDEKNNEGKEEEEYLGYSCL